MNWKILVVFICIAYIVIPTTTFEDDDFAEFDEEEFEVPVKDQQDDMQPEETTDTPPETMEEIEDAPPVRSAADDFEDEAVVEVEDSFDEFDTEEFEGIDSDSVTNSPPTGAKEELKFAKVPMNLRRNWANYYVEMTMIFGMLIYFLAFLLGRTKNSTLAQAWYKANKELLEANFSIVGDDGTSQEATSGVLMKESDHSYVMWCSGRIGVEGMLVQLKMVKRQDLVNFMQRIAKPATDQIVIRVTMDKEDMDNYIFCLAQKKTAVRLHKDMTDLNMYIESKKKAEDYGISGSYQVLSEIGEATKNFLGDTKVQAFLTRYEGVLEYMHFSDQFCGENQTDENEAKKPPEIKKSLIFCFNLGKKGNASSKDLPATSEWTKFVLYCMDKCRRFKLSREARIKSDKNRQKVQESMNKMAHQQRTELAQQRREDKLKAETERYMNEEDPIKARKLEEKRQKKDQARKLSKMKAVKIKSA